jgi:NitT/TauT family transport system ATP-binding protein
MTQRPGRIKDIIDVPLARPRSNEIRNSAEFVALRQRAWDVLKDEVQFGVHPTAAARPTSPHALRPRQELA